MYWIRRKSDSFLLFGNRSFIPAKEYKNARTFETEKDAQDHIVCSLVLPYPFYDIIPAEFSSL